MFAFWVARGHRWSFTVSSKLLEDLSPSYRPLWALEDSVKPGPHTLCSSETLFGYKRQNPGPISSITRGWSSVRTSIGCSQAQECWTGKPLSCLVAYFRSLHPCFSLPVSACHMPTSVCSWWPPAHSLRVLLAPEPAAIWLPLRSHSYRGDPGLTGASPCWVFNSLPNQWRERGCHWVRKYQWGRLAAGGEGGSPSCPGREKCRKSAWRGSDSLPDILTVAETPILQFAEVLSTCLLCKHNDVEADIFTARFHQRL